MLRRVRDRVTRSASSLSPNGPGSAQHRFALQRVRDDSNAGPSIPLRYTAALTFGGGSDAYARMVRSRHTPLLRLCFAALIAFALMLNGMSRVLAASEGDGAGNTVIIAGTIITLCQFDNDADAKNKAHAGHACDQCALRLAPTLPQVDIALGVVRFPQVLTLRPVSSPEHSAQFAWNAAWPRGPPSA